METYRIKLKTHGGILSPFQSDTIFGHLCWVIAYQRGEKELNEFLEPFKRGNPPFLISDGYPEDFLPKPFTAELNVDDPVERKELKKIDLINVADFDSIRNGKKVQLPISSGTVDLTVTPHNIIHRKTCTTLPEGGLYSLEEHSMPIVSIYFKTASPEWKDLVVDLFNELANSGYGKRKSIGKGHFGVDSIEDFKTFDQIRDANGFVSLSNFCPAKKDPQVGLYKTFVKYGKLGETFTYCGNPFKRPLLMLKAGSVFKTEGKPAEFYGRMVQEGIAPAKPEVVQYAYAFAVPIVYP